MEEKKIKKSWWKKFLFVILIIFLILFLSLLVAFGFYVFNLNKKINSGNFQKEQIYSSILKNNYQDSGEKKIIEGADNYWIGAGKPKITIVEFSDFSCPLSRNFFSKIREISIKYKNDVKIIFRDYPLYENSVDLAMAARCAGEQGLFWLMHDKLFIEQEEINISNLEEIAKKIGADTKKFNECFENKKYLTAVQKDFSDGETLGIKGTPTFFINGYKISGDMPLSLLTEIIEILLNNESNF